MELRSYYMRVLTATFLLSVAASVPAQIVPAGFSDVQVMGGFTEPVGFTFDQQQRMFVWEKGGRVWVVTDGVRNPLPLVDIREEVGNWRDHGALGFALDPDFSNNGHFYMLYVVDRHHLMHYGTPSYSPTTNEYFAATIVRLTRYTATEASGRSVADPASRFVMLGETRKTGAVITAESHGAGSLVFGTDGTLLVSIGESASYSSIDPGSDPTTYYAQALADSIMEPRHNVGTYRSQMVDCLSGKLLRLDPATGNGVPSNPYYDPEAPRDARSRVWALGFRNPYRMTLRPGSGSTNPADGRPGTLYIGDVGSGTWEELNVCYEPGMNMGWPLYQGMNPDLEYANSNVGNPTARNPLFEQGSCTQEFFYFKDLLKQESPVHLNGHPNPCEPTLQIPHTVNTFFHSRPSVDWRHTVPQSRVGGFVGNTAVTYDLNAGNSPVPGPSFAGNSSTGGTWITGAGWPLGYQNVYFHADYGANWIRRFVYGPDDMPVSVHDFATNMGAVVHLAQGPDGALWYIKYQDNAIRKVAPLGVTNLPPTAKATPSISFGPAPLTVSFSGIQSTDPEGEPLSYAWDFGDGHSATGVEATHTFEAPDSAPLSFNIRLTVTDDEGLTNVSTVLVSLNNTPPEVHITSFPDHHRYPVGVDTVYALEALVVDAEHEEGQLSYAWRTVFHHNNHIHPEALDTEPVSTTLISGLGCYEDQYWYVVQLTVTDAHGLSTYVEHRLDPRCEGIAPTAVFHSSQVFGLEPFTATLNGSGSLDNGTIVSYNWDFGDGTGATGPIVTKHFSEPGEYVVTLFVIDDDGLIGSMVRTHAVFSLEPPDCVGPVGTMLRESWFNISGADIVQLTGSPAYPDSPDASDQQTQLAMPMNGCSNCGHRARGYIIAPETGTYRFNVTADDAASFLLGYNADPQYARRICYVNGWTAPTQLDKYASQWSEPVELQAGAYYYFDLLHKEGGGDSHATIRWTLPGASVATVVPGSNLAPYQDCSPGALVRMALRGALVGMDGEQAFLPLMSDALRALELVPHVEPYTELGYTLMGAPTQPVSPERLAITGKNAIVDWVLLELRAADAPTTVVATACGLLQRDGFVVNPNGGRRIAFDVTSGDYYLVVRHRNHLGVMVAEPILFDHGQRTVDLTSRTVALFGEEAMSTMTTTGLRALWSGNAVADKELRYVGQDNDRDAVLSTIGGLNPTAIANGYYTADLNMDGVVRYIGAQNDRDVLLNAIGGMLPTQVRVEQLPR